MHYGDLQLGFFNKSIAAHFAPLIDGGARYRARVASLTGGPPWPGASAKHRGVNIFVERDAVAASHRRRCAARRRAGMAGDELAEQSRAA